MIRFVSNTSQTTDGFACRFIFDESSGIGEDMVDISQQQTYVHVLFRSTILCRGTVYYLVYFHPNVGYLVYASSSARSLAAALVTRMASCSALSMMSRRTRVETEWATVAA